MNIKRMWYHSTSRCLTCGHVNTEHLHPLPLDTKKETMRVTGKPRKGQCRCCDAKDNMQDMQEYTWSNETELPLLMSSASVQNDTFIDHARNQTPEHGNRFGIV
jgi:hypothetical protein